MHYTEGDEPTALKSVADLFAMSRDLICKGGPDARHFGTLVSFLLNRVVRPFTARWHKELVGGSLGNEDVRHQFREELLKLQDKLRVFGSVIGKLAAGDEASQPSSECWPQPEPIPVVAHDVSGVPAVLLNRTGLGTDIPFDRLVFDAESRTTAPVRLRHRIRLTSGSKLR